MRGTKSVFLSKDGTILDSDLENRRDAEYLSRIISFFIDTVRDKKGDFRELSIVGDDQLFIFYHSPYVLGVVTSSDINIPLLKFVIGRILENVEVIVREVERAIQRPNESIPVFDSGYRVSREDILEGFRSIADEQWKTIVLERIDGKKSVDDVVEEALPVLQQQGLKAFGGRDYTKEDLRGLIQDFLSTTVLKLKKE